MASPSWIRGLKELSKRELVLNDFRAIHNEIIAERHDRGAALVAATLVENMLRRVIRSQLVPLTETEDDSLFGRDAPLSTFSDMIRVGHAFGIFNKEIKQDLDRLREIRNAFAHSPLSVTFGTKEIASACMLFQYDDPKVYQYQHMIAAKRKYLLNAFRLVSTLGTVPRHPRVQIQPLVSYKDEKTVS
jgi:hypothetical protein